MAVLLITHDSLLHDARRAERGSDARGHHAVVRRGSVGFHLRLRCGASSRTRSATTRRPRLRRRALRATDCEPARPGRLAGPAAAGMGFQGVEAEITAPTLIVAGTANNVVDHHNADLLAARIPGSRVELLEGCGHLFYGSSQTVHSGSSTGFWDERAHDRQDHPRPRQDHARPDRDRRGRSNLDVRRAGRALGRAGAGALPRRPCLDADRKLRRARRADVRVREGGRHPPPDLVAARAAEVAFQLDDAEPAVFLDRGRASGTRRSRAGARTRVRPSDRRRLVATGRAPAERRRRPAAPDLHVGDDRKAERRTAHARRTASGRTSRSTSHTGSGPTTWCCRCCPSSTCGGWNVRPSSRGGRAQLVLERGFDAARALELIERERVTTMMGVPANYLFMAQEPRFADADLRRCGSPSSVAPRCPRRCSTSGPTRGVEIVQGYGLTEAAPERALPAAGGRAPQGRLRAESRTRTSPATSRPRASCSCAGRTSSRATGATRGDGRRFRDGWLLTGDVAERDDEGDYRILRATQGHGRLGGRERLPGRDRGRRCTITRSSRRRVVGVADERWGEVCAAFVVLRRPSRGRAARALPRSGWRVSRCRSRFTFVDGAATQLDGQDPEVRAEGARVTDVVTNVDGRPLSKRGLDARRRLLDAAEAVFGELGSRMPSSQLAEAAGVATGTFYALLRLEAGDLRRADDAT